jgi:hypothetical protein
MTHSCDIYYIYSTSTILVMASHDSIYLSTGIASGS